MTMTTTTMTTTATTTAPTSSTVVTTSRKDVFGANDGITSNGSNNSENSSDIRSYSYSSSGTLPFSSSMRDYMQCNLPFKSPFLSSSAILDEGLDSVRKKNCRLDGMLEFIH